MIPSFESLSPHERQLAMESRRLVDAFSLTLGTEIDKADEGIDSRAVVSALLVVLTRVVVDTNADMRDVVTALVTMYAASMSVEAEASETPMQ